MKNILIIVTISSLLLIGCGKSETPNTNVAGNGGNSNTAPSPNSNANSPATGSNANLTNANANANKPVSTGPKRISFTKGANWGAVNITLAAGASEKFVVSAKSGQMMDVEASSKEVAINLIKGKAETTEDFGFLNAELKANGDFVFEVRNNTKKEIKTSVKVTIEGAEPTATEEGDEESPSAAPGR